MSSPYPPAPRKLLRNPNTKMIGGVCAGVADYLNMDVTLVRILTVLITLFTGVPVILYIIALFIVPEGVPTGPLPPTYPPVNPPRHDAYQPGPSPSAGPAPQADPVWGQAGAPWEGPTDPERRTD